MGKILDKCFGDSHDDAQGRKKRSVIKNDKKEEYGWLDPNGTFYPVEFGKHQEWAANYILKLYCDNKISYGQARCKDNGDVGDLLTDMGWILIHNPHGYNFQITRNLSKRVTNKQKDYLRKIGKINELEKVYQNNME